MDHCGNRQYQAANYTMAFLKELDLLHIEIADYPTNPSALQSHSLMFPLA